MIPRRWYLALLALGAAACNSVDNSAPRENYAIVFADAFTSNTGYRLSPSATFFSAPQLSFNLSVSSADTCVDVPFTTTTTSSLQGVRYMDAGTPVTAQIGDATRALTKTTATDGSELYKITAGAPFDFAPGDSLAITVPGSTSGFPTFSIKGRTAETFTVTEPTPPAVNQPLLLSWSPAATQGSTMLVSLRYASSTSSGTLDRQVYCDLVDDGSFAVSPSLLNGWRNSGTRDYVFTRWRTEVKQINNTSFAILTSTLSVPTPGSQPTFQRAVSPVGGF